MRSLESVVPGFEERAARRKSDIKDSQKRATELAAKVGSPFEKEERCHKLVSRQSEIEEKLDLTKNQAPNQLDTGSADETEEKKFRGAEYNPDRLLPKTGCREGMNVIRQRREAKITFQNLKIICPFFTAA